jgi:preprotein translocase subunit SecY
MGSIFKTLRDIVRSKVIRKKILITLWLLALYRLLVFLPVPFVNIDNLMNQTGSLSEGIQYFAMLLGWSLEQFSIIAVWLWAYINASIIVQLLTAVIPALEELQEQGETGTQKIQQYTRRLSFPLAFVQGIWTVYFVNYLLGGQLINVQNFPLVLLSAFVLAVGAVMLLYIGELITEKGISNGISLIIFSSIVSGIVSKVYTDVAAAWGDWMWVTVFMLVIVIGLILLSVLILKTIKEVPVIYAKQGKVQESSKLPIPLNPVGMVPIIFAMAFVTFPYLVAQMVTKFGGSNETIANIAKWVEANLNIYNQQPSVLAIVIYFILIIVFTFFYAMIAFNPDRMSDNIQKRGGFIPGIRPGAQTSAYLSKLIGHLCFWWGIGLACVGVYTYVLQYIPLVQSITQSLGAMPVVVTGSGIIIIVWVVQEIVGKINSELLMHKYDRM